MTKLLVEGELDKQVLLPFLSPLDDRVIPVVAIKASKNALPPRTRQDRNKTPGTYYLRDRDFDFEPPDDTSSPVVDEVDKSSSKGPLGWRWCRHELENYLLEPDLVAGALGLDAAARQQYITALCEGAKTIRHYEAARWAVGMARRVLPPAYQLRTRPAEGQKKEWFLPNELERDACQDWLLSHVEQFSQRVLPALARAQVRAHYERRCELFTDTSLEDHRFVLIWFSGKDLMESVAPHFDKSAGELRAQVRDWMRENPGDALKALPEWQGLLERLRRPED